METSTNNSMEAYSCAAKNKFLSSEEQIELIRKYRETSELKYRERLLETNMRMVLKLSNHYLKRIYGSRDDVDFGDLVSEGMIGMMKAFEKYDLNSGNRFSTYATPWICSKIEEFLIKTERQYYVPMHILKLSRQVAKIVNKKKETYTGMQDGDIVKEISDTLGMPQHKVMHALQVNQFTIELDNSYQDDETSKIDLMDEFMDDISFLDESGYKHYEDQQTLGYYMDRLSDDDQKIIKMSYGIGCERHTLESLSKIEGVTREGLRKKTLRILDRMQSDIAA